MRAQPSWTYDKQLQPCAEAHSAYKPIQLGSPLILSAQTVLAPRSTIEIHHSRRKRAS